MTRSPRGVLFVFIISLLSTAAISATLLAGPSQCLGAGDAANSPENAYRLRTEADEAFKSARYEEAEAKYTESVAIFEKIQDRAAVADGLYQLGRIRARLGQYGRAVELLQKAFQQHEGAGQRKAMALDLIAVAEMEMRRSRYQPAIKIAEQALSLSEETGNKEGAAAALRTLGSAYTHIGRYREGADYGERSLKIAQDLGDPIGEAASRHNLGSVSFYLGHYKEALEYYQKAQAIRAAVGDKSGLAASLTGMANVYTRLGQYTRALEHYERVLKIAEEVRDKSLLGASLNSMGVAHKHLGNYTRALDCYQRAFRIKEEVGDRNGIAISLLGMADVYTHQGEYRQALDYYERASKMQEEIGDKSGLAASSHNIGNVYASLGRYAEALDYYESALKAKEEIGDKTGLAASLHNIGNIHRKLGHYPQALAYHKRALRVTQAVGDQSGLTASLLGIAQIHTDLGQYRPALQSYRQALRSAGKIKYKLSLAVSLQGIGHIYRQMGRYRAALDYYQRSFQMAQELGHKMGMASNLNGMGAVYYKRKDLRAAERCASAAVTISRSLGGPEILCSALHTQGLVFRDTGRIDQAVAAWQEAVQVMDRVRAHPGATDQKEMLLRNKRELFEDLVALLAEPYRGDSDKSPRREAFYYAERAKARAFLDLLEESKGAVGITEGIDPDLLQRENEIQDRLSHLQVRWEREYFKPTVDAKAVAQVEGERDDVYRAYEALKSEIRRRNPKYAELKYPEPITLAETQALLDAESVLLDYLLGKDHAFLFAVTKRDYRLLVLSRPAALERLVQQWQRALSDYDDPAAYGACAEAAYRLHSLLVKPAAELLRGKRKIIVSADRSLHYLPFEALLTYRVGPELREDFGRWPYLIKKYDIGYVPSAGILRQLQTNRPPLARPKELLIFADPIYPSRPLKKVARGPAARGDGPTAADKRNDGASRHTRSGRRATEPLTRLPYSGQEAMAIAAIVGRETTDVFLRDRATEDNIKYGVKLEDYRTLHVAAHGLLDESRPQFSALALTRVEGSREDGYLQTFEIFNLHLNADLVVLSSCKSGLGKRVDGEGLVGLTRAFLYAGAASLVVSLWNVQDRAGSEFMKSFYHHLKSGRGKAEALRLAKLEMTHSPRPLWRHPFYWAPFILMGCIDSRAAGGAPAAPPGADCSIHESKVFSTALSQSSASGH